MLKRIAALVMCAALSGCSATSALTGLIGSKPEISAQAGAENNKVGAGLTNKVDSVAPVKPRLKILRLGHWIALPGKRLLTTRLRLPQSLPKRLKLPITNHQRFRGLEQELWVYWF